MFWIDVDIFSNSLASILFNVTKLVKFSEKGSGWKEIEESLELELQQCYKAESRLSEQLVGEVAESRTSKALIVEKDVSFPICKRSLIE